MMMRIRLAYTVGRRLGKTALLLGALAAVASCGRVGTLQPAPGSALPVKPKTALTTPSVEELLTLPPQARPERTDEIQSRNRPREADRFDLPPPDGGAAPEVETDGQAENRVDNTGPVTPQ
jgi:hypothetical protein